MGISVNLKQVISIPAAVVQSAWSPEHAWRVIPHDQAQLSPSPDSKRVGVWGVGA